MAGVRGGPIAGSKKDNTMYAGLDMRGSDITRALKGLGQPFLSNTQAITLETVMNAIARGATVCLLTGAEGAGKTAMLDQIAVTRSGIPGRIIRLAHPLPRPLALQALIAGSLGLDNAERLTPAEMAQALQAHPATGGERSILLLVDDAQLMATETLSYLDLLYELLNWRKITLQVVLAGRPELLETLRAPVLASLLRRVGVHAVIDRLSPQETRDYLDSRLSSVGLSMQASITQSALNDVLAYADANPRRIDTFVGQMVRQHRQGRSGRITRKQLHAQSLIPPEAISSGRESLVESRAARVGLMVIAVLAVAGLAWRYSDPLMTKARGLVASLTQPAGTPPPAGEMASSAQALADTEIARLVSLAQTQIVGGHVASPAQDNALETLRAINDLLPRASTAGHNLAKAMPSHFADLARSAEAAGRTEEAGRFRLVAKAAMALLPSPSPLTSSGAEPVSDTVAPTPAPVPVPNAGTQSGFALPVNAPTHLVLYYARGNSDARANAAFLAATFRWSGLSVEEPVAARRHQSASRVNYFFVEDRQGATDVGRRLATLLGVSRPVLLAKRDPMPGPGTVEVTLP